MPVSLKYRIAIFIFVLEAIMMGIVLWQTLAHSEDATRSQLENTDIAVLDIVSGIGRVALLTEEYADLQPYLEHLAEAPRIEQALLIDARGTVVASSEPVQIGKPPGSLGVSSRHDAPVEHEHFWRSQEITNSTGPLGTFAIMISDEELHQATAQSRNLGIAIAVTGMAIIAFVGLGVGILLTGRLAIVTRAARRFAQGNFNARTRITGRDEMGELGQTFDEMAESLQNIQAEGEALIEQLSSKNVQLERFTYTVSHDLKTPLVTVSGFAGMLEKDILAGNTEAVKRDLQHILNGTDTMAKLLDDLLKLSQIGQVANRLETIALNQPFEQARDDLRALIDEKNAEIVIQPDMPEACVDRNRIYEVALNLLQNAMKFSSSTERVRIQVSAYATDAGITCCIEDNGIGIDPRYQDLIFGLFNRLDQSGKGTGIGLALVKSIIEAHNGTISVESKGESTGARFCFTIPSPAAEVSTSSGAGEQGAAAQTAA